MRPRVRGRAVILPAFPVLILTFGLLCGLDARCGYAWTGGKLALGVERITFHDDRLTDLYGSPISPVFSCVPLQRRCIDVVIDFVAQVSYSFAGGSPMSVAFIDHAETDMQFLPIRLQLRCHRQISAGLALWGGPQVAWAWFREDWSTRVPGAALTLKSHGTGNWLAAGALVGLRLNLGSIGAARLGCEWLWSSAQRAAVPGNDAQSLPMTGGWSGITLAWELP
ncbi:MAG: hypothetical protein KAY24_17865 [Candidatus Eisenbacteria sp.]|nr:hypothetical protein [Candidatus Eisenbacteria bacterium]